MVVRMKRRENHSVELNNRSAQETLSPSLFTVPICNECVAGGCTLFIMAVVVKGLSVSQSANAVVCMQHGVKCSSTLDRMLVLSICVAA
jgi:hypothetical protein